MKEIELAQIAIEASTQTREAISDAVVQDYAARMLDGVVFPPVMLFFDGTRYYIGDGFHRVSAAHRNGAATITAQVREGGDTAALWYALGANHDHGLRLSPGDKKRAVLLALKAWPERTQTEIADHIGCAQSWVSMIKTESEARALADDAPNIRTDTAADVIILDPRAARRVEIERLVHEGGKTRNEISAAVGVSHAAVDEVRRALGKVTTTRATRKEAPMADAPPPPEEAHPKAAEIERMLRDGATLRQIRETLHVGDPAIVEVRRAAGLRPSTKITASNAKGKAERIDRIRAMATEGYSSRQIAAALGLGVNHTKGIAKEAQIVIAADRVVGGMARHSANRIVAHMVMEAETLTADTALIDYADLDQQRLGEWITTLKTARGHLDRFISRLVKEQQNHEAVESAAAIQDRGTPLKGAHGAH